MFEDLVNQGISEPIVVFIVSMLPVVELRGALPVAINVYHIPWYYALPVAYIGNLLPVPFIFLSLERVRRISSRMGVVGVWVERFLSRTERRAEFIDRYGKIGLALFVAIPLPITGAWTGAIAAFLLGMKFRDSVLPICMGVLIAGIIVTVLCSLGSMDWVSAVSASIVLIMLALFWVFIRRDKELISS